MFSAETFFTISVWIVLYFGFFGLSYYVLPKFGISYATKPTAFIPFTLIYILLVAVIISQLLPDKAVLTVSYFEIIATVFALFVVGSTLYAIYRALLWYPKNETKRTHELSMRTEYLLGRLANVTFQQLAIYLLLVIMRGISPDLFMQASLLGALFGIIHLGLIVNFKDIRLIVIIFFGTLLLGFVIPYIYSSLTFPFATLLTVHYLAYVLVAPVGYQLLTALRIPITLTQSELLN